MQQLQKKPRFFAVFVIDRFQCSMYNSITSREIDRTQEEIDLIAQLIDALRLNNDLFLAEESPE